jgi:hypothetical protein
LMPLLIQQGADSDHLLPLDISKLLQVIVV